MKRFLIALQFLTVFPIRVESEIKDKNFGGSLLYFPLVGLLIGILLALTAFLFSPLPRPLGAVFILLASISITGGIHLDGFADTCDGFYGNRPKEKILEIMHDSHIGVMGVIGVVSLMLLKYSLFTSIPENLLWKALISMVVFSRWSQVMACSCAPYARREGKAKYFMKYATKKELIAGFLFTLAVFYLLSKSKGFILFISSFLPIFLFLKYTKKRIGGMTGDTIGALSELAEVSVLLSVFFIK